MHACKLSTPPYPRSLPLAFAHLVADDVRCRLWHSLWVSAQALRAQREEAELAECTFVPAINRSGPPASRGPVVVPGLARYLELKVGRVVGGGHAAGCLCRLQLRRVWDAHAVPCWPLCALCSRLTAEGSAASAPHLRRLCACAGGRSANACNPCCTALQDLARRKQEDAAAREEAVFKLRPKSPAPGAARRMTAQQPFSFDQRVLPWQARASADDAAGRPGSAPRGRAVAGRPSSPAGSKAKRSNSPRQRGPQVGGWVGGMGGWVQQPCLRPASMHAIWLSMTWRARG